ncbi:MAG: hypothetical protein DRG83_01720, partial [Deltaproteobacteria bacterium]
VSRAQRIRRLACLGSHLLQSGEGLCWRRKQGHRNLSLSPLKWGDLALTTMGKFGFDGTKGRAIANSAVVGEDTQKQPAGWT